MRLLALDTATEACSAAVLVDDEVVETYELAPRRHAELILPMIEEVLAETGLTPGQLDAVAFGRGPGAFTGLRIAAGVAQGIAFAAELPVVPVSTLAAIALAVVREHGAAGVAAAIDARMDEVYWGAYRNDGQGGVMIVGQECVCLPQRVPLLPDGHWTGAGSGWGTYGESLGQRLAIGYWHGDCYPRAWDVAILGAQGLERGQGVDPAQALPVYLRDRVALTTAQRD